MYMRINEKKLYNKYQIVLILLSKGEDKIGTDRKDRDSPHLILVCKNKQYHHGFVHFFLDFFLAASASASGGF